MRKQCQNFVLICLCDYCVAHRADYTLFLFYCVIVVSNMKDDYTKVPDNALLELCSCLPVSLLCQKLKIIIPGYP